MIRPQSLRILRTFINLLQRIEFQKAWSFIGPYGSTKSFFLSFFKFPALNQNRSKITIAAHKKLKEFDPFLAKEFKNLQANNEGYLKILISGSVEPIETKIYDALVETIEDYEFSSFSKRI